MKRYSQDHRCGCLVVGRTMGRRVLAALGASLMAGVSIAAELPATNQAWPVRTKTIVTLKLDYGDSDWVSAFTVGSGCTGIGGLRILPDSAFLLSEKDLFSSWKYRGTVAVLDRGKTMKLSFLPASRPALKRKVELMLRAEPRSKLVSIEFTAVKLRTVSRPEFPIPRPGRKQEFKLRATGDFEVIWVYDAGWPFIYRSMTVWDFDVEEKVVLGPVP